MNIKINIKIIKRITVATIKTLWATFGLINHVNNTTVTVEIINNICAVG